ncbi:Acetyltransferase (GNAT) family protein [Roseovarius litorisediminis]|uniref:Acetyltransferase (GNAT) family protein n=1 Tax=Roseovarius litorisediminis TaxID=1312363 RepID=A0A1Y5SL70_9RHOB|nr:GNAT family N-acetyltransferase [Roseovarius litorisediminis]SLN41593.1 Acetyltransferase (GNAT) family protein [Roseovarius litorisediminis]
MMPDAAKLYEVTEATWPPAARKTVGPWIIRDGQGGGKRVSSATARQPVAAEHLPAAQSAMQSMNQTPLFMIRAGDDALDQMLADQGYTIVDPVNIFAGPIADLAQPTPRTSTFAIWEPLAIQLDIWAAGGIGPGRINVMRRAPSPKTSIFGRADNRPAGTAFCAIHENIAMVHALEVHPRSRRQNMGRYMMQQAAIWAQENGATHMSVVCRQNNTGANALYTSLGLTLVEQYHYRQKA